MDYQTLLIENENGIITLTINRENALNALNKTVFNELEHFFTHFVPNNLAQIKGIVITGKGEKAFVAGADIKEFLDFQGDDAARVSKRGQDIFFLIERCEKPVIAAVNGFALGGGCELAMACHLRIAGEKARFGQPEVNLGIIPGYGGTQRLVQLIGKGKALEFLMTADMIGAEEAVRLGLANYMVAAGEEVNKSKEIINKIATKAPIAITKIIDCVNAHFDEKTDGYVAEYSTFGELSATKDFVEGASAFIEKRKANFIGK